jgi:hypothetical protein
MLLHLQLPLPLNANRPHSRVLLAPTVQELLIPLLADMHALAEGRGQATRVLDVGRGVGLFDVGDQRRAVRHVGHLAGGVGRFGDREDRLVGAVLRGGAQFCAGFGAGGEGLGAVHGLRRRWWVEGAVVAGEDVLGEWD